ncbi:MAG: SRPBCC domain-containing protein [Pseudomonadota bacterium]
MSKPDFMMQTYIRCTQDALWDALTDPDQMAAYHFMSHRVTQEDDTYTYFVGEDHVMLRAKTIQADPKSRIEATFEPHWEPGIPASRTVFLIAAENGHCRLTIEHYDLAFPATPGEGVVDGWERWASGLKTFLETGESTRFTTSAA